jgi:transposase-like protein
VSRRSQTSSRRAGGFQPPHCPNPKCEFHQPRLHWHFVRNGHRLRRGQPVQNFLCCHCHTQFIAATFSTTYRLHQPHLLIPCAQLLTEGACLRQSARILHTSHTTVARLLARLARHCLLFHSLTLSSAPLREPLVVDGFESFSLSQFFPFHANLAAGAHSWFLYHFTHASLRRKGAMTHSQKLIRAQLERLHGRPDPKAIERSMAELLKPLLLMLPPASCLLLHSDDHPAYPRALLRLRRLLPLCPPIHHRVTPATDRRTQRNPLFPVNLADLLLRHGSANHRRETIAFSKQLQPAIDRLAVFLVWRNYIKKRRENEPEPAQTAAMAAGVCRKPLTWRRVLRSRLFPGLIELPAAWQAYYARLTKTMARA